MMVVASTVLIVCAGYALCKLVIRISENMKHHTNLEQCCAISFFPFCMVVHDLVDLLTFPGRRGTLGQLCC